MTWYFAITILYIGQQEVAEMKLQMAEFAEGLSKVKGAINDFKREPMSGGSASSGKKKLPKTLSVSLLCCLFFQITQVYSFRYV